MPRSWLVPTSLRRVADALHFAYKTAVGCLTRRDAHVYDLLTLYRPLAAGPRRLEDGGTPRPAPLDPQISRSQLVRVDSRHRGVSCTRAATQVSEHQTAGQRESGVAEDQRGAVRTWANSDRPANSHEGELAKVRHHLTVGWRVLSNTDRFKLWLCVRCAMCVTQATVAMSQ